jgi:hypothetical protein
MAFQEGNQLSKGNEFAAKGRKVEKMIERALLQEDDKRLRLGVEALLDNVAAGERWALEFVRDSIDGKPKQQVDLGGQKDNPINVTHGLSESVTSIIDDIIRQR